MKGSCQTGQPTEVSLLSNGPLQQGVGNIDTILQFRVPASIVDTTFASTTRYSCRKYQLVTAGKSHSMVTMLIVGESEMCPCNANMTAEHLLQHYQLHDALRRDMWPEPKPLRDKLYGGVKKDSRFREGNGHLRLAYKEEEEE